MIRDDQWNLHRQLIDIPAVQQVDETVVNLGNHKECASPLRLKTDADQRRELGEVRVEKSTNLVEASGAVKTDPHAEKSRRGIRELVALDYVPFRLHNSLGCGEHDTGTIATAQGQDESLHRSTLEWRHPIS
jgi:hypothetical protein